MQVKENTCDVICIASNEGPYIAEFIHHYLYLGFSNIFIGLNNDSSGETGPIIQSIAERFPNIHLINTDQAHQNGKQRGSNCQLYSEAARISTSSHCMVVDVDEYWVTTPFSNKISDFLKEFPDANVILKLVSLPRWRFVWEPTWPVENKITSDITSEKLVPLWTRSDKSWSTRPLGESNAIMQTREQQ